MFEEAKFVQRKWAAAELLLDDADRSLHAHGGNAVLRKALDRSQGDEVAKIVESLSPLRLGTNQPEPLPVAKAAWIQSQDASHFSSRVSLQQAPEPPRITISANDYAPDVNPPGASFVEKRRATLSASITKR